MVLTVVAPSENVLAALAAFSPSCPSRCTCHHAAGLAPHRAELAARTRGAPSRRSGRSRELDFGTSPTHRGLSQHVASSATEDVRSSPTSRPELGPTSVLYTYLTITPTRTCVGLPARFLRAIEDRRRGRARARRGVRWCFDIPGEARLEAAEQRLRIALDERPTSVASSRRTGSAAARPFRPSSAGSARPHLVPTRSTTGAAPLGRRSRARRQRIGHGIHSVRHPGAAGLLAERQSHCGLPAANGRTRAVPRWTSIRFRPVAAACPSHQFDDPRCSAPTPQRRVRDRGPPARTRRGRGTDWPGPRPARFMSDPTRPSSRRDGATPPVPSRRRRTVHIGRARAVERDEPPWPIRSTPTAGAQQRDRRPPSAPACRPPPCSSNGIPHAQQVAMASRPGDLGWLA